MREELPDRYFYGKSKAIRIKELLKDVFPKKRAEDKECYLVRNIWKLIVGEEVYQCTEIVGLKNGILYVNVESSVMIHHLTNFEKHAIIEKISDIAGTEVKDIRFKVRNI